MTIYKTEGRIHAPKPPAESEINSSQVSPTQPLQQPEGCSECSNDECNNGECTEPTCDCPCDCEAQGGVRVQVARRQRPCSTWALTAICTVTVALSFLLIGLLYMSTRTEYRSRPAFFCGVVFPPTDLSNKTYIPETITVEEEEQIEVFDIPKFSNQHHITVMSDFRIHLTAFRDNEDDNCFLFNHNNSLFEAPRSVLEFMRGYQNGDHLTQLETIYARMEVQGPAVDVTVMAATVRDHCFQRSTFWLQATEVVEVEEVEPSNNHGNGSVVKRSVDSQMTSYVFFNGVKRVHVDLLNVVSKAGLEARFARPRLQSKAM